MKILAQRVSEASVTINQACHSAIDRGLLLLIGVEKGDSEACCAKLAKKILAYRMFADDQGKMNLNVEQISGSILAVSQFTLAADTEKGLRPGFSAAASPDRAKELYEYFVRCLKQSSIEIKTGVFAADMKVALINDGPVTFLLEA